MRLPTETVGELNAEETTWRLLAPWGIGPAEADLERHTVYTFQARWCDSWRRGRLLLRYSGTEALARVMIEGEDEQQVHALADELATVIRKEIGATTEAA
jgi:hypothetical protein